MRLTIITTLLLLLGGCAADSNPDVRMAPETELAPHTSWPLEKPGWSEAADVERVDSETTVVFDCEVLRVSGAPDDPALCELLAEADLVAHDVATLDEGQADRVRSAHRQCPTGAVLSTPRLLVHPNQAASIGVGNSETGGMVLILETSSVSSERITFRYALQMVEPQGTGDDVEQWSTEAQTAVRSDEVCAARATSAAGDTTIIMLISARKQS